MSGKFNILINNTKYQCTEIFNSSYIVNIINDTFNNTNIISIIVPNVTDEDVDCFIKYLNDKNNMHNVISLIDINTMLYLLDYFGVSDKLRDSYIKYVLKYIIPNSDNHIDCFIFLERINSFNNKINWEKLTLLEAGELLDMGYSISKVSLYVKSNIILKYNTDNMNQFRTRLYSICDVIKPLTRLVNTNFIIAGDILSTLVDGKTIDKHKYILTIIAWKDIDYKRIQDLFFTIENCDMVSKSNIQTIFIINDNIHFEIICDQEPVIHGNLEEFAGYIMNKRQNYIAYINEQLYVVNSFFKSNNTHEHNIKYNNSNHVYKFERDSIYEDILYNDEYASGY